MEEGRRNFGRGMKRRDERVVKWRGRGRGRGVESQSYVAKSLTVVTVIFSM